jgi:hypothetical protein
MPDFTIKTSPVSKSDNPSHWKYTLCEIFQDGVKIGEFERNYPNHGDTSFKPFKIDGQWYATYSASYNKLSIMTLPDCKHWCDVEHTPDGVCPTEVIVNPYITVKYKVDINGKSFKDTFVNGICTQNYWWLNEDKTDSRILTDTYDYHEVKDYFDNKDDISFNSEGMEKIKKLILQSHINIGHIQIDIPDEPMYSNKIIFEGCYWGGPYDLWWIDVENIAQMQGKDIPLNFLEGQAEMEFDIKLRDRLNFGNHGAYVITTKHIDFNKKDEK